MKKYRLVVGWFAVVTVVALAATGCRHQVAAATNATVKGLSVAKKPRSSTAPLTRDELKIAKPNEGGLVPILEYHNIKKGTPRQVKAGTFRSPDEFRKDLQRLYDEGYRPISLSSFLDNRIDTPYGTSPVILTFDDALPSQFTYMADSSIDPDCAVGIMQAFNKQHPDFPLRGVFFVLPTAPGFGPSGQTSKKLQELLKLGFEIGNHTITHPHLNHLSDDKVQYEIATCAETIEKLAPGAHVDTLALPMGLAPHNKALEASGEYHGLHYKNRAVLLVGAEPARSPISKRFNPMKIPRVQAIEGLNGITFWLDRLKASTGLRYISDGDPNVTTIPKNLESRVDRTHLNGAQLRIYGD